MKKRTKAKTVKRSTKHVAEQNEMPDLVTVMLKVAERLETLERKMEQVISQTAPRPAETGPSMSRERAGINEFRPAETKHVPQHGQHHQTAPAQHPGQRSYSQHQHQGGHQNKPPQQNHGRHERTLYQAVCADCRKQCEVPFKPTGERPVFCKACFAQRKSSGNGMKGHSQPSPAPVQPTRHVRVFPNGGGKVTISEVAAAAPKRKQAKPAKKAKR